MIKARRPTWIFDDSPIDDPFGHGERAVDFLRRLHHPKSEDGMFALPRMWERLVRRVYGPCLPDGTRQVRRVFVLLPRGARKTTLGAGLSLLHTVGYQRVKGGQAMVAGSAEEDASLAFEEAVGIIKETPWLEGKMKLNESTLQLSHPLSGAKFRALASAGKGKLGKTPQFVLADELIAWEGTNASKMWSALSTGLNKAPNTLMMVITQAGRGQENLAFDLLNYARRVQSGEVIDPTFLPVLFETDPDEGSKWFGDDVEEFDSWTDERLWHFVNPGLADGYPDLSGLRAMVTEGLERPKAREDFQQFHLNMWLGHSASPFVDMPIYDQGRSHVDLQRHEVDQTPCWLAVDLSSTTDLTAIVGDFYDGGDHEVAPWFFCPEDNLQRRADRDQVPYPQWAEEGLITPTPGNVVDFDAVEAKIVELCATYNVREIAFDPALGRQMINSLMEKGLPAVEMRQGWVTMGPAVKALERAILGRQFRHGGHPILRWHFDNVTVKPGPNDTTILHKGLSRDRIDGAVAAAMAVARAEAGDTGRSSYDDADVDDIQSWAVA